MGPVEQSEVGVVRVTVDRREKNVQDYAGAATALSQEDLNRTGVTSVRDMSSTTPYVEIGTQDGNTEIYVRGVGSNNNTELGDPATATHIDGVYIPRPRGVGTMFFDLERVEVNRGPQGTLRGRNATAGSINMVTNKPKLGEFGAEASAGFGNYSQRQLRGMINIPIGDTLALRIAATGERHDPFYENAGPVFTLRPTEDADTLAYRIGLKWNPMKELTVLITHDRSQEKGTGWSGTDFAGPLQAGLMPEEVPHPRSLIFRGPQAGMDQYHWGINGDVMVDLGPVLINYLGSYRYLKYFQTSAGNAGTPFPGMQAPDIDNWSTSWFDTDSGSVIQELRVMAPDTAKLRWAVGGFYFRELQHTSFATVSDKSSGFTGVEYTMPHMVSSSLAGYADATYDILKTLRATAGLRLTTEHKERTGIGNNYSFGGLPNNTRIGTEGFKYAGRDGRTDFTPATASESPDGKDFSDYLNGIARPGARDTLTAALNSGSVTYDVNNMNRQDGKNDDTYFDWRVGLDTNVTPDNLLYVMFSTGHKSGGFNDQIRITPDDLNTPNVNEEVTIAKRYKPEVIYSTEIGAKNQFLNKKLTVNVAAFWYEYKDLQFQVIQQIAKATDANSQPAGSAVRFNAAGSRILGFESDATWHLPVGFSANLQAMVLDSRFTDGTVTDTRLGWDPSQQVPVDLKGNFLARSPVLSLNYSLSQYIPTPIGAFDWMINAQTKTKYYMTPFNSEGYDTRGNFRPVLSDVVPSYTRFDIAAGWTRNEGDVRVDAFVNNVTDIIYMTSIIAQPGQNLRFFNPPRQMGARITVYL